MKKISAGIEPLKQSIRIWWRVDGVRERETLSLPPTAKNLAYANKLANNIKSQLALGVFDRFATFGGSNQHPKHFFYTYIEQWLSVINKTLAPSSLRAYQSKVEHHIRPKWGNKMVAKITITDFEHWVYNELCPKLSNKTIKEIIMIWRKIWEFWARHEANPTDPSKFVKLTISDSDDIDPYTKDEISRILSTNLHTDPNYNLWVVMLWSGLSIHEILPLAVEDLEGRHLFIKRGFVDRKHKVTKNRRRRRQVELLPQVQQALLSQAKIVAGNKPIAVKVLQRDNRSYKTEQLTFLWYNKKTGTHHSYPRLEKMWINHLKRVGVRHRPPNNGRHTYASQVLSTGAVSAEWLANQLGHTSTDMIHKHYGKFIPSDARHLIDRLAAALNNQATE